MVVGPAGHQLTGELHRSLTADEDADATRHPVDDRRVRRATRPRLDGTCDDPGQERLGLGLHLERAAVDAEHQGAAPPLADEQSEAEPADLGAQRVDRLGKEGSLVGTEPGREAAPSGRADGPPQRLGCREACRLADRDERFGGTRSCASAPKLTQPRSSSKMGAAPRLVPCTPMPKRLPPQPGRLAARTGVCNEHPLLRPNREGRADPRPPRGSVDHGGPVAPSESKQGKTRGRSLSWAIVTSLVTAAHTVSAEPDPTSNPAPSAGAHSSASTGAAAPPAVRPPTMVDARGPSRILEARPARPRFATCSLRRPVCVQHDAKVGPAEVRRALAAAERGLDGLAALRLPWPRTDFDRGGGPQLDVYLDATSTAAHAVPDLVTTDPDWDLAAAFVVAPPGRGGGCVDDAELSRAVVAAALIGLDAGAEPQLARGAARHLGALIAPCGIAEIESIDAFQRTPESGFEWTAGVDAAGASDATGGAALFFAFLEERYGSGRPGELTTSLLAAAPQRTPLRATVFQNEPDIVDVLVDNAKAKGSPPFGELLLDFSVARAFVGTRSDNMHLADVARFGDLGRVRFDWSVDYASLPRTLAPAFALQPTGATYIWVDLEKAPGGVPMTVVATWEPPVEMRWAIVKIAPDGSEQGRLERPTRSVRPSRSRAWSICTASLASSSSG